MSKPNNTTLEFFMPIRLHPGFMAACKKVASDWRDLAHAIRKDDAYASHVTEDRKEADLQAMLLDADTIESGEVKSFTIWQRVNTELTGECVAFLP